MDRVNIAIYSADFPKIDPNVLYDKKDIDTLGYELVEQDIPNAIRNDIKAEYGIPMMVKTEAYNLVKIQRDFDLHSRPETKYEDDRHIIFCDDIGKTVLIEKSNDFKYKKYSIREFLVYQIKNIGVIKNSSVALNYLLDSYMETEGISLRYDSYYLLHQAQINELDAMAPDFHLLSYYDRENPNLFLYISRCESSN